MATMLPMPNQIDRYREMSALSAQMVEAAQAGEWDRLIELESGVTELRNLLMSEEGDSPLSAEDVDIKRALIQRILDDDAEVRRHTEPWMEHVRQYLGSSTKRREIERAYGAIG